MIADWWRDSSGDSLRSNSCSVSFVLAPTKFQNMSDALVSSSPASSSAETVFSYVGSSGLLAIASISAKWAGSATENAASKSRSFILVKSGRPSGSVQA